MHPAPLGRDPPVAALIKTATTVEIIVNEAVVTAAMFLRLRKGTSSH
jgi:hypothetical protein